MDDAVDSRRWMLAATALMLAFAGLWTACNEHPVGLANADGIYTFYPRAPDTEPLSVDVLWVIDNSGTMCQEQELLRERFGEFVEVFSDKNVDLNIGVTTTHMASNYSFEPLARPAQLQASPQPIPSTFQGCMGSRTDHFEGVRAAMEGALACAKQPGRWPQPDEVTDDDIACAIDPGCAELAIEDLFPNAAQSPYREIPTVLSAADERYRNEDDHLDLDALERDFACISFVGTRGYPLEKGLSAAVEAVSPQMTGGSVEDPIDPQAPNHGLLRRDAAFALIFVTDENDCSHDGSLVESSACYGDVCELANHPEMVDSPLIPTEQLAEQFLAHLRASKGRDISRDEVVVASLHGRHKRYGAQPDYPASEPPSVAECDESSLAGAEPISSCESGLGSAFSGDRYERFLLQFEPHRIYPAPTEEREHLEGLLCQPKQFDAYMRGVAQTIVGSLDECVTRMPIACAGPTDDSCAGFAFGGGQSQCTRFGKSDSYFCDSAVQVRLFADERSLDELRDHAYCIPESVDSLATPDGCVVDRQMYGFTHCSGLDAGIKLEWSETRWFEKLDGFEIEIAMSGGALSRQ